MAEDPRQEREDEQAPPQETQNDAKEGPDITPMGQTDEQQDEEDTTAPGGR